MTDNVKKLPKTCSMCLNPVESLVLESSKNTHFRICKECIFGCITVLAKQNVFHPAWEKTIRDASNVESRADRIIEAYNQISLEHSWESTLAQQYKELFYEANSRLDPGTRVDVPAIDELLNRFRPLVKDYQIIRGLNDDEINSDHLNVVKPIKPVQSDT